jgi:4-amino-4-deoxy-L-arabinose transferase-like glycosyltransferase
MRYTSRSLRDAADERLLFVMDRHWRRLWRPRSGGPEPVAYALGTIAFTYSTQFLGHQLAAVLAFTHFALSRDFEGRVPWWKLLAAGALAGLGAITDYFSAIVHLIIIASYVTKVRPVKSWAPFLAGGAAAFAPPAQHFASAGDAHELRAGARAAGLQGRRTGFFGVTLPRLSDPWSP